MKVSKNIKYIVIIIFIVFFVYIINSGIKEGFDPNALVTYDSNSPKNSHNVDVVNNPYSCSNFCGPKATCIKTGEQCTSDIDCSGCQPSQSSKSNTSNIFIPGNNENGILTNGVTPTYSVLTSNIGFNSGLK